MELIRVRRVHDFNISPLLAKRIALRLPWGLARYAPDFNAGWQTQGADTSFKGGDFKVQPQGEQGYACGTRHPRQYVSQYFYLNY